MNIIFKDGCENLSESLNIPQERSEEMEYRLLLIAHEFTKPQRKGEKPPKSDKLIKLMVSLAENEQELIFCSYIAGTHVARIFDTSEEEYKSDENF